MLKRTTLILVLFIGVFVSPSHAQEPSNPYIYYFSDTLNAFIIERADGTDTRVLGDGLMALTGDAFDIHVAGPGWSPSGQWFAWMAAQVSNSGTGISSYRPYVLSVDGMHRLTLLDHLQDAQLVWAMDNDLLFVASRQIQRINPDEPEDMRNIIDTYLAVIDVATETVVSVVEDQTFYDYELYQYTLRPDVIQTNDGQHFIVEYTDIPDSDSLDGVAISYVFDTKGEVFKKQWDAFGPTNIEGMYYSIFPSVSTAGWVVYPTKDSFQIENVLSGEQHILPPIGDPEQIIWDASGQYALIIDENLWLLDCSTATLTLIRETWRRGDGYHFTEQPTWSPDSNYALLIDADDVFYVFNRSSGKLSDLPIDVGGRFMDTGWYWLDDSRPVIYQTSDPGFFMIYDLEPLTMQQIPVVIPCCTRPRLSPNERYVAYVDDGAVIYDRDTATATGVRPDYAGFRSASGQEIVWHDSGDWLLIFDDALIAGGAHIRYLGIARADGTQWRDLSFSWVPTAIALNWLPPQVEPGELPPPISTPLALQQPEKVFYGSQWSFYVDWSPDGRWIAAGQGWNSVGNITVWEVDTGEVVHIFQAVEQDERVMWPQGELFVPKLVVPEQVPVWRNEGTLAQSPDGHQVVQNKDQITQVVDTDTGKMLAELPGTWDPYFRSASYSPDGRLLAAANPFMPLRIWRTDTWELVAALPYPGQAVAFSPDGTQLAVIASWDVQLWDVDELLAFGVSSGESR